MNGRLSEHPLAELIHEISEKGFSGALRIERERVKAVIYFEHGALVYATSNLRAHRLSEFLRQHGLASRTGNESTSDVVMAEALLSAGTLTRQGLDQILAEQVNSVMRAVLLWTDGGWTFDGRAHLSQTIQVKIATQQLLLETGRRLDQMFTASRLPSGKEPICPATDAQGNLSLLPTEAFLLTRVEGSTSLDEIVALSGQREPDAKQVIYALLLAGLLKREYWQHAFRTAPPQTVSSEADNANRALKSPAQPVKPEAPPEPKPDPRQQLDAFLERLSIASNHYEVLNVSFTADVGEIKRVYHTIARNFHPDRFHDLTGTMAHTRLQSGFARVTQAYETLTNAESRAAHDGNIQALRRVRESQAATARTGGDTARDSGSEKSEGGGNLAQLAEKRFQEGAVALQQGQTNAATSCFSAAARMAPNEPKYRAYFGRALAANPKTRREAEGELQAAVKLDPQNAQYHVMLAVLYRDLGFGRRAVSEAERALAIDPHNEQARQLLSTSEK